MAACRWLSLLLLAVVIGIGADAAQPVPSRVVAPPGKGAGEQPSAPPEMRIAAVVNDDVISMFDVVSRVRMVLTSSNIPDSQETRQRLAPQVLRSLIDERLELQEAKKEGVSASDAEINGALAQIEKQNNMQSGQLNEFMKQRGMERGTLVDQLKASIVWAKLVRRKAAETVDIADDEIDDAMKRVVEHAKDPQSRIAEIFLAVDNPTQDEQVRQLADRLSLQMKQGARFSAIARQFSKSATAAVGGDMGWLRADQLPAELGKVVSQLKVGELSSPVHTTGGYYLLLVVDRRNAGGTAESERVYDLVQVVFPLPANSGEGARRAAISAADGVRSAAKDCPSLLQIGKEKAPQLSSEGKLREDEISPQMRALVEKLSVGQPSEPIVQKNGVGVIMVCAKPGQAVPNAAPTRQQVAEGLLRERLDTVARRYLNDLRRNSYVDVRG